MRDQVKSIDQIVAGHAACILFRGMEDKQFVNLEIYYDTDPELQIL